MLIQQFLNSYLKNDTKHIKKEKIPGIRGFLNHVMWLITMIITILMTCLAALIAGAN